MDETAFLFYIFLTEKSSELRTGSKRIDEIAVHLNRSVGSIHRKLEDIRSNEPSYAKNGLIPTNCANLVKDIWVQLGSDYDSTKESIRDTYVRMCKDTIVSGEIDLDLDISPGLDIPVESTRREGQPLFRRLVANNYDRKCCITGISMKELLVASHIKPWSKSTPVERTDPRNGLYLNRLHDGLFDRHLMTIDEDMRIVYADSIRKTNSEETFEDLFGRYEGHRIEMPTLYRPGDEYLSEHRKIFEAVNARRIDSTPSVQ